MELIGQHGSVKTFVGGEGHSVALLITGVVICHVDVAVCARQPIVGSGKFIPFPVVGNAVAVEVFHHLHRTGFRPPAAAPACVEGVARDLEVDSVGVARVVFDWCVESIDDIAAE